MSGEGPEEGDADVAVVGLGPVGAALAILVARAGHRVVVLERFPEPYRLPRAVHFDHEAVRILQGCGLGDRIPPIAEPAGAYEWRNGEGLPLLRFRADRPGVSGWPASNMINQPQLEDLLDERLASVPHVDVRRGVEVVGLEPDDDGVTIECADGSSVRARYVVGCDGANSTVRTLVGAPVHDLGFFYDWLVVDVLLDEPRVFDPPNIQICDPERPTTLVSGGPGRRRWEFMRLPDEPLTDLEDEATPWRMLERWDVTPDNATLERSAVYRFQARWVERWRTGSVLLAGDAAHQMPPFAGQGLCSGLRDVANLSWKLDLVLRGLAADSLLDTYEVERMPHVERVIDFSMALGKVICVPDPDEAAARDETMAAALADGGDSEIPPLPGITEGVVEDGSVGAGELFPQGMVAAAAGGAAVRFDDRYGAGWRLVVGDGAEVVLDDESAAWFESIGGGIVAMPERVDVDGTYREWFAGHGVVAALQRPDFHVFGSAVDAGGAAELVDALRTRLA